MALAHVARSKLGGPTKAVCAAIRHEDLADQSRTSVGANGREIETSISAKSVPRMGFGRRSGFKVGIAGVGRTKGAKEEQVRYTFVIAGSEINEKFEQTPMHQIIQ